MASIKLCVFVWELNAGDKQVVLFIRGVSAQDKPESQTKELMKRGKRDSKAVIKYWPPRNGRKRSIVPVYRVVLAFGPCNVWQPLCSERRPLQGMGHHQVIEEWCILLPYFIFFVDNSLFDRIIKSFWK